ncbi:MAG: Rrf2 family transcriptional regulator [Lachnospiraceae bacterium]|nr:Rrf2 family transcriptional regulator [Lachnospiraceae bacterium]
MQISSRFTIAIHVLTAIDVFQDWMKTTSELLASSVHTNPVVIRRILQQLKAADMIEVARGSGGAKLKKEPDQITLFDIYCAVDCVERGDLFRFHDNPNIECPVGRNIHAVLDGKLMEIQTAFENEMKKTTLADILLETKQLITKEEK